METIPVPPDKEPLPILVVDDDLAIRLMLETVLEEEGYSVVLAHNGREGLEIARQQPLAMILLDLMMPILNGWQFLEVVKQSPELQSLPIVVLSASREIAQVAREGLVKAYLPKPFEIEKLLNYVELYTQLSD